MVVECSTKHYEWNVTYECIGKMSKYANTKMMISLNLLQGVIGIHNLYVSNSDLLDSYMYELAYFFTRITIQLSPQIKL